MAERRMFAKAIIDSDAFLDMPMSTQALYFHLSMRADDDGFINNPKRIQRMIGASDDDLKLLIAKSFLIVFESGVVVIKHWKIHNYIRNDRYKPTTYVEEKALLVEKDNKAYTLGIPSDNQVTYQTDTQDRLGKDRIGKDRLGEDRLGEERVNYQEVVNLYNDTCVSFPRVTAISEARKKAIKARLNKYSLNDLKKAFELAEESDFLKGNNKRNWTANFDWILKDANIAKILDGNYANKEKRKSETAQELDDFYNMAKDWAEE